MLPFPIPTLSLQPIDDCSWSKEVIAFFMDIIAKYVVDAGWQACQAQDGKRMHNQIVGQFPGETI